MIIGIIITSLILIYCLKTVVNKKKRDLKHKGILIIGGGKGLGFEIAKNLYIKENFVYIADEKELAQNACKMIEETPKSADKSEFRSIQHYELDLSNINKIYSETIKFDIIFYCKANYKYNSNNPKSIEEEYKINYFNPMQIFNLFLEKQGGNFVFVTCSPDLKVKDTIEIQNQLSFWAWRSFVENSSKYFKKFNVKLKIFYCPILIKNFSNTVTKFNIPKTSSNHISAPNQINAVENIIENFQRTFIYTTIDNYFLLIQKKLENFDDFLYLIFYLIFKTLFRKSSCK